MPEAEQVNRLFSGIAPCYDQANQVLSLGIDRYWRRTLVSKVVDRRPRRVVDLATGSGDVVGDCDLALLEDHAGRAIDGVARAVNVGLQKELA